MSRKTLEALGKAVTPGSKQLEPELRACLSLGSSPSGRAGGSTAALGRQSVVQALGASCLHPSQSGAEGPGHGSVSTHMPCAPGPAWRGCGSLDSTWRGWGPVAPDSQGLVPWGRQQPWLCCKYLVLPSCANHWAPSPTGSST